MVRTVTIARKRSYKDRSGRSSFSSDGGDPEEQDTETTELDYLAPDGKGGTYQALGGGMGRRRRARVPTDTSSVLLELGVELGFLAANVCFATGSCCFFTWCSETQVRLGVRLFIIGSLLGTGLSAWQLHESLTFQRNAALSTGGPQHNPFVIMRKYASYESVDLADGYGFGRTDSENWMAMNHLNRSEDSGGVLEGGLSALSGGKGSSSGVLGEGGEAAGHEQRSHIDDSFGGGDAGNREVLEGLCYCLSCAIFAISSVLYEPRLFGGKPQETHAHALGSWCFIAGSLGFAMVTLYSALNLPFFRVGLMEIGLSPSSVRACVNLQVGSLVATQIGSIFFVVGSVLFRPGLNDHCDPLARHVELIGEIGGHDADDNGGVNCVNNFDEGTWLYVWGSALFVGQSIAALLIVKIKHDYDMEDPDAGLEVERRLLAARREMHEREQAEEPSFLARWIGL